MALRNSKNASPRMPPTSNPDMSNSNSIIITLIPVLTLIMGALLGFISSMSVARFRKRVEIENRILDEMFGVRRSLTDLLSDLASLEVASPNKLPNLNDIRISLSKIYYSQYDFLPSEVLIQINCLYSCLRDVDHKLYKFEDNKLLPMTKEDIFDFTEKTSIVDNFKYSILFALFSEDPNVRQATAINLHARRVLITLNKYFTIRNLMSWVDVSHKPYPGPWRF